MDNLSLLNLIIYAAGLSQPWSQPIHEGQDWWTYNQYMDVPKERWKYNYIDNVNSTCENEVGKIPNKQHEGCVSYTPDDEVGLWANIFLPNSANPNIKNQNGNIMIPSSSDYNLKQHEERHAAGQLHPQYPLAPLDQLFNTQRK